MDELIQPWEKDGFIIDIRFNTDFCAQKYPSGSKSNKFQYDIAVVHLENF